MSADLGDPDNWKDRDAVVDYLAEQAACGRLILFVGSGVSVPFGLPTWDELLAKLAGDKWSKVNNTSIDSRKRADYILDHVFYGDRRGLIDRIRDIFYERFSDGFEALRKSDLLLSIMALASVMSRNGPARIITTNYDTLIEEHLRLFGLRVHSTDTHQMWNPVADVVCYHPHGIISQRSEDSSNNIVLTSDEFDKISKDDSWHGLLSGLLQSHTVLFVGVSGDDSHLDSLGRSAAKKHAIQDERAAFAGVRLEAKFKENPPLDSTLAQMLYTSFYVPDFADYPGFLFDICVASTRK